MRKHGLIHTEGLAEAAVVYGLRVIAGDELGTKSVDTRITVVRGIFVLLQESRWFRLADKLAFPLAEWQADHGYPPVVPAM